MKFIKTLICIITFSIPHFLCGMEKVPDAAKAAAATKVLQAVYYKEGENEPVKDWLRGEIDKDGRKKIGIQITDIEHNWPHHEADVRDLETNTSGLWELRSNLPNGDAVRIAFLAEQAKMVLLHSFLKHADIQLKDVALAEKRAKEYRLNVAAAEKANEKHKEKDNEKAVPFRKLNAGKHKNWKRNR